MPENDVLHTIRFRRSVMQPAFSNQEVTKEEIETLLEAANAAPTHKRTQPWRFVVFKGEGLKRLGDELAQIYKQTTPPEKYNEIAEQNMAKKATMSKAAIAIIVNYTGELPEWEELAATACAVQNMWLASCSIGLGGYWASPGLIKHLGDFLKLEENQQCLGFFYVGRPDQQDDREPVRTPITERVRWEE